MSSTNQDLAKKIVDQLATVERYDATGITVEVPQIGHKENYFNTKTEDVTINSDGDTESQDVATDTTEAEAIQMAIDDIAAKLDAGDIILGDQWEKDNLSAENADSEETHSEE